MPRESVVAWWTAAPACGRGLSHFGRSAHGGRPIGPVLLSQVTVNLHLRCASCSACIARQRVWSVLCAAARTHALLLLVWWLRAPAPVR